MKKTFKKKKPFGEVGDLAWLSELGIIINDYRGDDEDPLDGDDVDRLIEHLRNKINLMEGNITEAEYHELEEAMMVNPTYPRGF